MTNPYENMPKRAFWKPAIGSRNALDIDELWTSKYPITQADKVATSGSCFAQHLSRAMIKSGFSWIDSEPAADTLPEAVRAQYGYGVFSYRTGNIYNVSLLRQWLDMATGRRENSEEVWEQDGRIYDPLRPAIEPGGFGSVEECMALRRHTLDCIRDSLPKTDLFVFTLGLTEGWVNTRTGLVYPMCPGTIAGEFSESDHAFHNYTYPEIRADLEYVIELLESINPKIKVLLTVSPVPLTATASGNNVLVATTYSKSVLRSVAGDVATSRANVDYFPSYEIIASAPFKGMFFEPNMRSVSPSGVAHVMKNFFRGIGEAQAPLETPAPAPEAVPARPAAAATPPEEVIDVQCEEALLDAFAK